MIPRRFSSKRVIEIPDQHLNDVAELIRAEKLSALDYEAFLKRLDGNDDIDILAAPRLTTANERQAQISSMRVTTENGKEIQQGPVLDFIPVIAADGSSISLTIQAVIEKSPKE